MAEYTPQTWLNGPDGHTPVEASRMTHIEQGISNALTIDDLATYVTDDELADAIAAETATIHQVPAGGTGGQVLGKISATDWDINWVDQSGGGGGGAVDSVNGHTGVVVLGASDVGASPSGAYVLPGTGVPKTDLAAGVQTSLGKADTALQSAPVTSVFGRTGAVTGTYTDVGAAAASHTHVSTQITDATTVGKAVLTAVDAPTARAAIGAGTGSSNLAIGTTGTTAKAGDYQPASTQITDATTVGKAVLTAVDAPAARTAIGAGTSSLALGTTSSTAKRGDYTPASTDISDSTAVGRAVIVATDAAAARTAIGAGTGSSNLALGTTNTTAKAGDYQPTAANISDSTSFGRAVLTGASNAAILDAITAVYRDRTVSSFSGFSPGYDLHLAINVSGIVPTDPEPVLVETLRAATLHRAFWLNESGSPRGASIASEPALKLFGPEADHAYTGAILDMFNWWTGSGSQVHVWGMNMAGQPLVGTASTIGSNVILLNAADAVPTGLPVGTIIARKP